MPGIGLLALIVGLVALCFAAVRRASGEGLAGPTGFWMWACAAIFASGFCTHFASDSAWSLPIGYALGTAYPALLLSGALAYAGRRVPSWLPVLGVGVGFARGLLALRVSPELAQGIALAAEPLAVVLAATLVARSVRWESASFAQRSLGPALLAIAGIEAATAAFQMQAGAMPATLQVAFVLGSPLLLALQIAAVARRADVALRRSRQELAQRVEERTAELRVSEERYRIVSELSSDYSFALRVDSEQRIEFEWVTDGLERITGYAPHELESDAWQSLVPDDRLPALLEGVGRLLAGEQHELELAMESRGGEERWLSVVVHTLDPEPDGAFRLVGAGRDITERRLAEADAHRLEVHLREAQRIESLGVLAGGIAHDFNNMLTVILGNVRLAREELEARTVPEKRLDRIEAAASHARRLTQQMLTYSGTAAVSLRPLDLTTLVRELGDLLQASVAEKGLFVVELADDLPAVEGDATQLRQVVLNLVTNAAECLGDGGGRVRVRTALVEADAGTLSDTFGESTPRPGSYVALEVSDDGPGLEPEMRARVFEPFFTTKPTGRGLGLAAVLGIVRAHRGVIRPTSVRGAGSTFQVLLPASSLPAQTEDAVSRVAEPTPPILGGRVLLVDDDEPVREIGREFLERAGFEVRVASGGREAIEMFRRGAYEFDLVVLDLRMPEIGGERVFLEMRRIRPDLPVVLTSGFDERRAAQRFSARGVAAFLGKPFEPDELVETVRNALVRASTGSL